MAPLVFPNAVIYTINGTYDGNNVANVIAMRVTDEPFTVRSENIDDQAGDILNNWVEEVMQDVSDQYVFEDVSWVDINSPTGSTGTKTSTGAHSLPQVGAVTSPCQPGNVAALVTKVAPGGGRRSRNGRLFLVGIPEVSSSSTNPNALSGASRDQITASMEAFASGISNSGIDHDYESNLTVLRTESELVDGVREVTAIGNDDVSAMQCESTLATQRRRLRR